MSITLDKVLARLESELERAMDTGNVQKKREHLAAMKSLCELALETEVEAGSSYTRTAGSPTTAPAVQPNHQPSPPFQQQAPTYTPPTQAPPITNIPSKPIKEDDANGDSLFDF
ncbi:YwdI family protein [Sutcliffiella horikoshii]|uniref:YwdI family protein n=1 Tax=Sutcliffiella horikoshii TaxID=79883 RepID=UPI002040CF90|nr:YwdI family protein [Sutcliffiella horikoshii]MCM3618045.1 YwdI family protein [Sutcliffiella horikoshii]